MKAGLFVATVTGILVLLVATVALNGFMLSYMWEWFVVPLGAPGIGIPQAIGIAVLVSMLTYEGLAGKSDGDDVITKVLATLFAKVFAFGIAFGLSFMVPA